MVTLFQVSVTREIDYLVQSNLSRLFSQTLLLLERKKGIVLIFTLTNWTLFLRKELQILYEGNKFYEIAFIIKKILYWEGKKFE